LIATLLLIRSSDSRAQVELGSGAAVADAEKQAASALPGAE
jgi:hypothetical protein